MYNDEIEKVINDIPVPLETLLTEIPAREWLRVVQISATARFKATKQKTARASYFHDISVLAGRYLRILKS